MRTRLLWVLLLTALIFGATTGVRRLSPAYPAIGLQIEGRFTPGGQYPGQPLVFSPAPRTWGSWSGDDANEGVLKLGPFPAPAKLRLALSGYPHRPGNDLFLEMPWLGIRFPLEAGEIGERWEVITFDIPLGWQGRVLNIVAIDHSHELGGWLAVSEPLPLPGGRKIEFGFAADMAAWIVNGLLLGVCFVGCARWLRTRAWLPTPWIALAAGGIIAVAGYVAFWIYLVHPIAGRIFSMIVLAAGAFAWIRSGPTAPSENDDWISVAKLAAGIGVFYLALLHLFVVPRDFYDLAENRFVAALPGDNRLPHDFAALLYHGQSPKKLSADWISSDRPPLESGWQLLTWPAMDALGFGATTASGTAALWLQLLWVPAAFGLLRTLGVARTGAMRWTALLALSGFFLQNSLFTWPKLSAAAFGCAAFALWVQLAPFETRRARFAVAGGFAALAWLSHGGVAFSFLPLVPWVAWRVLRGEWRRWLAAAAAFLVLALPWVGYQKFYDPPGNRLLKWHLGGQIEKDSRGLFETIRDGYAAQTWQEIRDTKLRNFAALLAGNWTSLTDVSAAQAEQRRSDEFYFTGRSLGWWSLGFLALPLIFVRRATPELIRPVLRLHGAFVAWIAGSLVVWCLLMFGRDPAVLILGSYATVLGAFVLLSAWCEFVAPRAIVIFAALQAVSFSTTWAVANSAIDGPLSKPALSVALAAIVTILALLTKTRAASDPLEPSQPKYRDMFAARR